MKTAVGAVAVIALVKRPFRFAVEAPTTKYAPEPVSARAVAPTLFATAVVGMHADPPGVLEKVNAVVESEPDSTYTTDADSTDADEITVPQPEITPGAPVPR